MTNSRETQVYPHYRVRPLLQHHVMFFLSLTKPTSHKKPIRPSPFRALRRQVLDTRWCLDPIRCIDLKSRLARHRCHATCNASTAAFTLTGWAHSIYVLVLASPSAFIHPFMVAFISTLIEARSSLLPRVSEHFSLVVVHRLFQNLVTTREQSQ